MATPKTGQQDFLFSRHRDSFRRASLKDSLCSGVARRWILGMTAKESHGGLKGYRRRVAHIQIRVTRRPPCFFISQFVPGHPRVPWDPLEDEMVAGDKEPVIEVDEG